MNGPTVTWRAVPGSYPADTYFDVLHDGVVVAHDWIDSRGYWWTIPAGNTGTPKLMAGQSPLGDPYRFDRFNRNTWGSV